MGAVFLVSYTLDPRGEFNEVIRERMPLLKGIYDELLIVAMSETDGGVIEQLEDFGYTVVIQEDGVGYDHIRDARRMAVSAAADESHGHTHFVDFDRILQWAGFHPDELLIVLHPGVKRRKRCIP